MATIVTSVPLEGNATSESARSAVSWPAIFAGAVVAIAATMILVALGSGLGFAAASPWPGVGPSLASFAIGAGIWLIVTQWVSAGLGGYITGRLRTRWTGVHTDEVLFRDTAHGLLAWAVSTVIVAGVALAATASTLNAAADTANTVGYATDTMLRSNRPADPAMTDAARAEIGRLLARPDGLGFGGGGGKFGLWVDANLERGASGACETFDNRPLASSEMFRVVRVEAWAFQLPSSVAAGAAQAAAGLLRSNLKEGARQLVGRLKGAGGGGGGGAAADSKR